MPPYRCCSKLISAERLIGSKKPPSGGFFLVPLNSLLEVREPMAIRIFYDGDCPLCHRYVQLLRLRQAHGNPQLVDLRQNSHELDRLRGLGFNLDQGMAVMVGDQVYHGDAAMHVLSQLSTRSTLFNRMNRVLFSSSRITRLTYPIFRMARNVILFLIGRSRLVREAATDTAAFSLFSSAWGLFAILHAISYSFFSYGSTVYFSTIVIGVLGVALCLRPRNTLIFVGLLIVLVVDACMQMPLNSNHTIIKNFLLLAMLVAGARQLLRGGTWADFYKDFAPVGRMLLVTMYIFGIFHKINRDFLDPTVSCAVALWRAMPPPLNYLDGAPIRQFVIYGTFLFEGSILLLLLLRRTRHWGIAMGIAFHSFLALSSYAMYVQFSMLTIALHMLFIENHDAIKIQSSTVWQRLQVSLQTTKGFWIFGTWLAIMIFLGWNGGYSEISIVWMPSVFLLAWACLQLPRNPWGSARPFSQLRSPALLGNILSILFFLNCAAPYLGLKTSQSLNMFANLQLEAGRSNHLVFAGAPGPFGYMADVVSITAADGSPVLEYVRSEGLKMTYYHLLDQLERNPKITASFEHEGRTFTRQNATSLADEIKRVLHPRWARNWFHFTVIDMASPKPCALDR
jgi:predicted DCC family thiol-disulfide oxidoreductase YuxK